MIARLRAEDRVDLVHEQGRRVLGPDRAKEGRFRDAGGAQGISHQEREDLKQPALSGALRRRRHREVGRHLGGIGGVRVRDEEGERDRLRVAHHDEPPHEALDVGEQRRERPTGIDGQPSRDLVEVQEGDTLNAHAACLPKR